MKFNFCPIAALTAAASVIDFKNLHSSHDVQFCVFKIVKMNDLLKMKQNDLKIVLLFLILFLMLYNVVIEAVK